MLHQLFRILLLTYSTRLAMQPNMEPLEISQSLLITVTRVLNSRCLTMGVGFRLTLRDWANGSIRKCVQSGIYIRTHSRVQRCQRLLPWQRQAFRDVVKIKRLIKLANSWEPIHARVFDCEVGCPFHCVVLSGVVFTHNYIGFVGVSLRFLASENPIG